MKKFEDAIKALEAVEGGAEFVQAINDKLKADVEAEKNKGIKAKTDANNEAKGLRERLKKIEEPLGLDSSADDIDERVTEFKTLKEKGTVKPNVKADPDYIAMKKLVDDSAKKLEDREKKDLATRDKSVKNLKKASLTKAMSEKKVIPEAMDDLMVALDGRLMVDDDDNVTWKGDAEGESFSVEDGLGKFLEKKPIYVGNDQRPGGGGGPGAGGGTGTPKKEPTDSERRMQLEKMNRSTL